MNPNPHTSTLLTRRSTFGLLLAGLTLPASRALAAKDVFIRSKPHVNVWITAQTFSGQTFTAQLSDDLTVSSNGWVRGFLRLDFGGGQVADYVAERGSLTFDPAGEVASASVLLLARRSSGRLAEDFAFVTLRPAAEPEECVVYDLVGPGVGAVHGEPVRFDAPGSWVVRR
jgi:hypothetical protein